MSEFHLRRVMAALVQGSSRIARACGNLTGCSILIIGALSPVPAVGAPDVIVANAWVRAPVPGQPVAAAYMEITSARGGTLQQIGTDAAGEVQVHSMRMEGDIMRMRQLRQLPLPAGQTTRLAPSGTHLMLLDLKRPLRPGAVVRFNLTVRDTRGQVRVIHAVAPVRAAQEAGRP